MATPRSTRCTALYDIHEDGSGVCYGSMLRPILNMRPKFRYRTLGCAGALPGRPLPGRLARAEGHRGRLPDRPRSPGGRAPTCSGRTPSSCRARTTSTGRAGMLDALADYLDGGGRFMYMGGNGLFGVVSLDPERPHLLEVRRWGTRWPYEMPPAERHHSMTGEPGGTWRNRGRARMRWSGSARRAPGSIAGRRTSGGPMPTTARGRSSSKGSTDELIGDEPNLQVRWGAAGYEFDRVDAELGSPASTLLLASSVRFNASHKSMVDDEMYFTQGRDGAHGAIRRSRACRIGSSGRTWRTWSTRTAARSSRPGRSAGAAPVRPRLWRHGVARHRKRAAPLRRPGLATVGGVSRIEVTAEADGLAGRGGRSGRPWLRAAGHAAGVRRDRAQPPGRHDARGRGRPAASRPERRRRRDLACPGQPVHGLPCRPAGTCAAAP